MQTWKQSSLQPDIQRFVDGYWFIQKTSKDQTISFPLLNPDTSAHLVLADYQQGYNYTFANHEVVPIVRTT